MLFVISIYQELDDFSLTDLDPYLSFVILRIG